MNSRKISLALIVFALCFPAFAKKPVEQVIAAEPADTPEKFEVVVAEVRSEIAPGKRYEFLRGRDLETVERTLDQMTALLVANGSIGAMNPEEVSEMITYQERVNGLLARNADDRLVCSYDKPVGSHIPKRQCYTAREIARNREDTRRAKDELNTISARNGRGN